MRVPAHVHVPSLYVIDNAANCTEHVWRMHRTCTSTSDAAHGNVHRPEQLTKCLCCFKKDMRACSRGIGCVVGAPLHRYEEPCWQRAARRQKSPDCARDSRQRARLTSFNEYVFECKRALMVSHLQALPLSSAISCLSCPFRHEAPASFAAAANKEKHNIS